MSPDPCTGLALIMIAGGVWTGLVMIDWTLAGIKGVLEEIARKMDRR